MIDEEFEKKLLENLISGALFEDGTSEDITTRTLFDDKMEATAVVKTKTDCIVSGLDFAKKIVEKEIQPVKFSENAKNGYFAKRGEALFSLTGSVVQIMAIERVILNLLQRLCGVATLTAKFVEVCDQVNISERVNIMDTRKGVPMLRLLDKKAVADGGGTNHRFNLADELMLKTNHLNLYKKLQGGTLSDAISKLKEKNPQKKLIVEVTTAVEAADALAAEVDVVVLDNFSLWDANAVLEMDRQGTEIEYSGGVNLENVVEIAALGVERISIGSLTHSVAAIDIGLYWQVD